MQLEAEEDAKARAVEMAKAESAQLADEKIAQDAAAAVDKTLDEVTQTAEDALEGASGAAEHTLDDAADAVDEVLGADPPAAEEAQAPSDADEVAAADGDAATEADHADAPEETGETPEGFRRRTLDDAVMNVLREEAHREETARREEGTFPETQPDLGIGSAVAATVAASKESDEAPKDRVARIRGDEDDLDDDSLNQRAARRELLPDIEEINSTLTATSERGAEPAALDAPETIERRRSGVRLGFTTILLIAAVLLFIYLLAKPIATAVPPLEPALQSYVATVDEGRIWLDDKVKALIASMRDEQG